MPFARTDEQVQDFRLRATQRRERSGQPQRPTTRAGRAEQRDQRENETKEETMRTALNQPHRRGLPKKRRTEDGGFEVVDPSSAKAGFVLGRLLLHNAINRDQYVAGQKYAELAIRHMQHVTAHSPKFPSQAINDSVKGLACTADMTDEEVFALRRSWNDAQTALADTCEWQACASALISVCVMDREVRNDGEMGSLRVALNALHRLWR